MARLCRSASRSSSRARRPDGSWTWRAAGAREPRGVLDGTILPSGSSVGDQLRVETEKDLDGIRVLSVVPGQGEVGPRRAPRAAAERGALRARRAAPRPRRARSDGPATARVAIAATATVAIGAIGDRRRPRATVRPRDDRGGDATATDRAGRRGRGREGGDDRRRQRPHFTPPPEVPQRPKPKRLRPGKQHRTDVLAATPEEQRPVAELALQGMAAVRQRLREDNVRLKAEGKPEMPEAAVMKMAEDLLPRLRVADWLDRAEAAQRQLEHLDLRDLRSVVASSDDPLVARDETTRELAAALKAALVTKQEEELDALARRRRGGARRRSRRARPAAVVAAAEGRRARSPAALATRLAEADDRLAAAHRRARSLGRRAGGRRLLARAHARRADRRAGGPFGRAAGDGEAARPAAPADRRPVRRRGRRRTRRRRSRCARRPGAMPRRSRRPSRSRLPAGATTRRPRRRQPRLRTRRSRTHRSPPRTHRPRKHRPPPRTQRPEEPPAATDDARPEEPRPPLTTQRWRKRRSPPRTRRPRKRPSLPRTHRPRSRRPSGPGQARRASRPTSRNSRRPPDDRCYGRSYGAPRSEGAFGPPRPSLRRRRLLGASAPARSTTPPTSATPWPASAR